jgi:hypothetical protein
MIEAQSPGTYQVLLNVNELTCEHNAFAAHKYVTSTDSIQAEVATSRKSYQIMHLYVSIPFLSGMTAFKMLSALTLLNLKAHKERIKGLEVT